jgi:hypothetical protein
MSTGHKQQQAMAIINQWLAMGGPAVSEGRTLVLRSRPQHACRTRARTGWTWSPESLRFSFCVGPVPVCPRLDAFSVCGLVLGDWEGEGGQGDVCVLRKAELQLPDRTWACKSGRRQVRELERRPRDRSGSGHVGSLLCGGRDLEQYHGLGCSVGIR